jgi:hypothetical protein
MKPTIASISADRDLCIAARRHRIYIIGMVIAETIRNRSTVVEIRKCIMGLRKEGRLV